MKIIKNIKYNWKERFTKSDKTAFIGLIILSIILLIIV